MHILFCRDEPLIRYYNDIFLPVMYPEEEDKKTLSYTSTEAQIIGNQKIEVGGLVRIGFQRSVTALLCYIYELLNAIDE